jgi:2-polyprenyl-3-methyl-5-hydroxy-6-metoxy-1,4-benzoquinol methylase
MCINLSPTTLSVIARHLYHDGSLLGRTLQRWRPYICPFQPLIEAVPPGSRILDVGCGGGLFLGLLAHTDRIAAGYGFDANRSAIRLAEIMRRRLTNPNRLYFEHRDAQAPWPEGPFDVVSMIDVMHHVPSAARFDILSRAASRLVPGGLLLYKDMAERPFLYAWANRTHDLLLARQWIHYSPIKTVKEWTVALGLDCEQEDSWRVLCYAHEFMLLRRRA